jgi:uncharacterized protein (TIGR00369 family)
LSDFNEDKKLRLKQMMEELVPFNRFLGIQVEALDKGYARLVLPYRAEFVGDPSRPATHGGVISTLIDTAAGVAAFMELEHSDRLSTVDLVVDYLLPAGAKTLQAEAQVVRIGNRVAVVQVTVRQLGVDEVIAQGRAVFNVVRANRG